MAIGNFKFLLVLVWNHFMVLRNNKFMLIFRIVAPCFLLLPGLLIDEGASGAPGEPPRGALQSNCSNDTVYAPDVPSTRTIMEQVLRQLGDVRSTAFARRAEMVAHIQFAGVFFDAAAGRLAVHVDVARSRLTEKGLRGDGRMSAYDEFCVRLQSAVEDAVGSAPDDVTFQQLDESLALQSRPISATVVAVVVLFSLFISVSSLVRHVAFEKEKKLKAALELFGVPSWLQLLSWFAAEFLLCLWTVLLAVVAYGVALRHPPILPTVNWLLVLVTALLLVSSLLGFGVMVSVLIPSYVMGSLFMSLLMIGPSLISVITPVASMSLAGQLALCIFPTFAASEALRVAGLYSTFGARLSFRELFRPFYEEPGSSGMSVGLAWVALLVDTILFSATAVLVDTFLASKVEGTESPFRACGFLCRKEAPRMSDGQDDTGSGQPERRADWAEQDPTGLPVGCSVRGLTKAYHSNGHKAVDDVTINFFTGHVTAILGHNGAGKTTLMSMISGFVKPTSGSVVVGGHDLGTDPALARRSVGLCPQHNLFWDELTVEQHLRLFCYLKLGCWAASRRKATEAAALLGIEGQGNLQAKKLSGGQKRKLCIAIALCGDTDVVVLDEPTSGLDPESRRELWDVLGRLKEGRCVLLSTHYMEEAEALSDRIAILTDGRLNCVGTKEFLKQKLGSGYLLTVTTAGGAAEVSALVSSHVADCRPSGSPREVAGALTEVTFVVPFDSSRRLCGLLRRLEAGECRVGDFRLESNTLEDVFLKAGVGAAGEAAQAQDRSALQQKIAALQCERTSSIWPGQMKMVLKKRLLRTWRMPTYLLSAVVIAMFSISINLLMQMNQKSTGSVSISTSEWKATNPIVMVQDVSTEFQDFLKGEGVEVRTTSNLKLFFSYLAKQNPKSLLNHYPIAFQNDTVFYQAMSTRAKSLGSHLLFKFRQGQKSGSLVSFSLSFISHHRVVRDGQSKECEPKNGFESAFFFVMIAMLLLSICYLSAYFATMLVAEMIEGAYELQLISGLQLVPFWLVNFVFDVVLGFVILLILASPFFVLGSDTIISQYVGVLMLCFVLVFVNTIIFLYRLTFHFQKVQTAFNTLAVLHLYGGVLLCVGMFFLFKTSFLQNVVKPVFLVLLPSANCIDYGLTLFQKISICRFNPACQVVENTEIFLWRNVGKNVACFFFSILFYSGLLVLRLSFLPSRAEGGGWPCCAEDADVRAEQHRATGLCCGEAEAEELRKFPLVANNVRKVYAKGCRGVRRAAVGGISVAVPKGEIFGLLGSNGAGKSSTFKMICGQTKVTAGDLHVVGLDAKKRMMKIRRVLGYCPQEGALSDFLTPAESIRFYAQIAGMRRDDELCEALLQLFVLQPCRDQRIATLSGGNRRKVAVASALVGRPELLLLDEPTAGLDPQARRAIWRSLKELARRGITLVFTSHSMNECELLSDRLAIMTHGQLRCIGTPHHLKVKFGSGVSVHCKPAAAVDRSRARRQVLDAIPGCQFISTYGDVDFFALAGRDVPLSDIFAELQRLEDAGVVRDVTVVPMSLESIFMKFARQPDGGDGDLRKDTYTKIAIA